MTFRPITLRTTDLRRRTSASTSPAKRAVRVIQGLQKKLSPIRRKIRDDVEVTAPMRPAPRGPSISSEIGDKINDGEINDDAVLDDTDKFLPANP